VEKKMIYYDLNGFHETQDETNSRLPITEEERDKVFRELNSRTNEDDERHFLEIKPDSKGYPCVVKTERSVEETKEIIRRLRTNRVFPIINRSNFWFNSLTQSQKDELQVWYQEWLNATKTLKIPKRPEWLE
jgi:hypothetical protein